MNDFINIRGYAVPFNQPTWWDGDWIKIEPTAFDAVLASVTPPNVPILWGAHDDGAPRVAKSGAFFVDNHGLGFSATLDMRNIGGKQSSNWGLLRRMTQRVGPLDQCSLNLLVDEERPVSFLGSVCRNVARCTFDHIALVEKGAFGTGTGVWPTHCSLDEAPYRIKTMAAQWERGREMFQLEARRRKLLAAGEAIVKGKGRGNNGDLSDKQLAMIDSLIARIEAIDYSHLTLKRGGV